jgi:hypothetical protein
MNQDSPDRFQSLDRLRTWVKEGASWCGSTELSDSDEIFDTILQDIQLGDEQVYNISRYKKSFDSHLHVGAFRKLPEETISKRSLPVTAATTPWHNLLDNRSELSECESPQESVNRALEKLDVPYRVATRILQMVAYMPTSQEGDNPIPIEDSAFTEEELIFVDDAGVPHSIQSLGSGIGVIVPVVVALSTTETELLSIEEPESHVHPKLQAELGDIVIAAASGNRNKSVFIETHSEHLILRILRRIRETTEEDIEFWPNALKKTHPAGISPDDVAVIYVEPGEKGATIVKMPMDANGEFTRDWPGGFFEERMKELF